MAVLWSIRFRRQRQLPYVHAAYVTPSGHGLKVIVKTNSKRESYTWAERVVAMMFEGDTGFARDNRCKDIARIQYISYDPDLVYNPDSEEIDIWSWFEETKEEILKELKTITDPKEFKKTTVELELLYKNAGLTNTQTPTL